MQGNISWLQNGEREKVKDNCVYKYTLFEVR